MQLYEGYHACPASRPLEFPSPTVHLGCRETQNVLDHLSGIIHKVANVLMPTAEADRAYLIQKIISKTVFGVLRQAVVLQRRTEYHENLMNLAKQEGDDTPDDFEWVTTERLVVIKVSSWERIRHSRRRRAEDPVRELCALQLVGDYHPNVIGALDVLQDEDYLYIVMTFCTGGALSGQISEDPQKRIPEPKARVWFKQLLSGMRHLQRKGICHQDLSLENILIDREDNLVIIDLGMALRIPYSDPANIGHVTDISEGTERCLILSQYQGTGRSQLYLAPELVAGLEAFDGFAIDLWALGVILFLLLVGIPPFTSADSSDERFEKISEGGLKEVLIKDNISISEEAIDLLQNMLWQDPRKRLGLSQIFRHPWVKGTRLPACIVTSNSVEENEESGDSEQNKSPFPSLPIPNLQDLQSWFSLGSN